MPKLDASLNAFASSIEGVFSPIYEGLIAVGSVEQFKEVFTVHGQALNNLTARARTLGFDGLAQRFEEVEQIAFSVLDLDADDRLNWEALREALQRAMEAAASLAPRHSRLFGRSAQTKLNDVPHFTDEEAHLKRLTILVADDESESLAYLRVMLYRLQAERVIMAESTTMAMDLARGLRPDIIIANWQMEGEAGLTFLDALRNCDDPVLAHTPFILMARARNSIEIAKAWSAGVSDLVMKPVTILRLQAALRKAVSGHYVTPTRLGKAPEALVAQS